MPISTTVLCELTIPIGNHLSRGGYIFLGWSENKLATTIDYYSGQRKLFSSATTLYAVWKNKNNYKFINQNMAWSEAEAYCEKLGGYLVTITSAEENNYIASILASNGNPQCWAGASDEKDERTWKWVSGEEWDYTNWGSGQPDDPGNSNEDYLHLGYCSDNKWNDASNSISIPFICEWNSEEEMLNAYCTITYDANGGSGSVASVSTKKLDEVSILNGNHLSRSGYIFLGWSENKLATTIDYYSGQRKLFSSSTILYAVWKKKSLYKLISKDITWLEAKAYCEKLGGYLVTITSKEEQNYVADLLKNSPHTLSWLGASDEKDEKTWKWVSGEKWDYTNWGSGQPDDSGNAQEDYLQLGYCSDNKWNDASNSTSIPFICEWNNEADKK